MISELTDKAVDLFSKEVHSIDNPQSVFDPAMIFIIAELVVQVIEMMNEYCAEGDPDAAADLVNKPSRLSKVIMKRTVKKSLGRSDYRLYGKEVLSALYKTGEELSADEMAIAYNELFN